MKKIPVRQITENRGDDSFRIRDVESLLNGQDLIQELHRHDFFFILALHDGAGTHEIDFEAYNICDNVVFFLRPGQVHQLTLKAGSTGYLIEFNTAFYRPDNNVTNQRLRKASNKNACTLDAARSEKIQTILHNISREYAEKQEGYLEVIKANLDILFIELVRQSDDPHSLPKDANQYTQTRLDEFLELLEIHITSLRQASQYASLLNLSLYQLNSITRATVGKTASELINERIVLEAKRYLLATPAQVKDIAYHLGYEDVAYFIRFFKKQTGFAPEAFRNNFR